MDKDGTLWLDQLVLGKNDARELEERERKINNFFIKRIKVWSYFALALSGYVMLNVFIGFSSAPYYNKYANCNSYNPTDLCASLGKAVSSMYYLEFLGGLFVCF